MTSARWWNRSPSYSHCPSITTIWHNSTFLGSLGSSLRLEQFCSPRQLPGVTSVCPGRLVPQTQCYTDLLQRSCNLVLAPSTIARMLFATPAVGWWETHLSVPWGKPTDLDSAAEPEMCLSNLNSTSQSQAKGSPGHPWTPHPTPMHTKMTTMRHLCVSPELGLLLVDLEAAPVLGLAPFSCLSRSGSAPAQGIWGKLAHPCWWGRPLVQLSYWSSPAQPHCAPIQRRPHPLRKLAGRTPICVLPWSTSMI